MAQRINKKSYLQKYISGSAGDSIKKKKNIKGKGLKIFDDDVDITKIRHISGDELDILDEGEDAPQIAGIIDERPEKVKKMEQYNTTSKWRVINKDDGFNSSLEVKEIKRTVIEEEKEKELEFGKMYSDPEADDNDSDPSPPRKNHPVHKTKRKTNTSKQMQTEKQNDSKLKRGYKSIGVSDSHNHDSDASPPRKHDTKTKPKSRTISRWDKEDLTHKTNTTATIKPKNYKKIQAKTSRNSAARSPPVTKVDRASEYINSINSLPTSSKTQTNKQTDTSELPPLERQRPNPPSPVFKHKFDQESKKSDKNKSPPTKKAESTKWKLDSSSKRITNKSPTARSPQDCSSRVDSQNSRRNMPKRFSNGILSSPSPKRVLWSDSDHSPIRRSCPSKLPRIAENEPLDHHTITKSRYNDNRKCLSPLPKGMRTLDGKLAGLQNASQMRKENESFKKKENDAFRKMNDEVSGRNAQTVSRKREKQNPDADRDKAAKQKMLNDLYKKWNKGVKQVEAQTERVAEYVHEAAKPLARHTGDVDLEDSLKKIDRDGDPMLDYMREKKRELKGATLEKPKYKGRFLPNRFNIPPGYRWDGVDRSNGYEKKYFETQSNKKAQDEDYYKWASSDM